MTSPPSGKKPPHTPGVSRGKDSVPWERHPKAASKWFAVAHRTDLSTNARTARTFGPPLDALLTSRSDQERGRAESSRPERRRAGAQQGAHGSALSPRVVVGVLAVRTPCLNLPQPSQRLK